MRVENNKVIKISKWHGNLEGIMKRVQAHGKEVKAYGGKSEHMERKQEHMKEL